eukprot:g27305.t1
MNDFCARMVVDDLIQNALKEDVCSTTRRGAAGRRAEDRRSEVGGSVVEAYDDYDEDDVVSLSGEADSDEEEVETFNMVCQVAKRAVTQSLHQAKWISSSAPVVRQIQTLPADAWQAIHARFQVNSISSSAAVGRRELAGLWQIQTLPADAWQAIHARFQVAPVAPQVEKMHLIKTLPSTAWDAIHQRFHPQAAGIGSRAPRQIQTLPADAWQAIHARFQVAPVPQVEKMHLKTLPSTAWDAIHQRFQVLGEVSRSSKTQLPFHMSPSVGTWMVPHFKPRELVKEVKEETVAKIEVKEELRTTQPLPFHMSPSVGTWMVPHFKPRDLAPAPPAAPAAVEPKESEPARRISTAKSKRRIIGAIVPAAPAPDAVAPTEKRPENPAPPAEKRPMTPGGEALTKSHGGGQEGGQQPVGVADGASFS